MNKQILEAPNYQIDEKGNVTNISKGNPVFAVEGRVRLYVNAKDRKSFKVSELLAKYFSAASETEKKKTSADSEKKSTSINSYKDFKKQQKKSKLNEEDVKKIKELWATGKVKQKEIAEKYNVHSSTISEIINGKTRKNER